MTAPRPIVPGATTAITRRTTLRKAFLAPWDDAVQQCWQYALADAQRHTDVDIHHGIAVITHHHLCVTPERDNLPDFSRRVHRDVSASLNTVLSHHRYDAPGELFDGREPHYQRLCDAPAQAARLIYDHNNCVAAGLVSHAEHMPGRVFDFDLWKVGHLDVRRPDVYFESEGDTRPEVIRMRVTPPPLLYRAFDGDIDRLVYYMKRLANEAGQRSRSARKHPALGARAVQRLHPWSEPRSLREPGGRRVPTFSIGAEGVLGWQQHIRAATEVRGFRRRHREIRNDWRVGKRDEAFPFGTYAMRVEHGAPVEPAPDRDAIITRPGVLLAEVKAELADIKAARDCQPAPPPSEHPSGAVIADVRRAFEAHADDICDREALDFSPEEATGAAAEVAGRQPVHTRHRFDTNGNRVPAGQAGAQGASRVVVLRDKRRGRPRPDPDRDPSVPIG